MAGDIRLFATEGSWVLLLPQGRGQGCCYMSKDVQDRPQNEDTLSPNVSVADVEEKEETCVFWKPWHRIEAILMANFMFFFFFF